jgi:hypothetical protein
MKYFLAGRAARALVLILVCLSPVAAFGDARALSNAEREAVQIVSAYLAGGPEAIVQNLSTSSRLRALAEPERSNEIAARLGPPKDTTWKLITVVDALKDKVAAFNVTYASGVDDTIIFELVPEGGKYRISDVRILALPVPLPVDYPQPVARVEVPSEVDQQIARKFDFVAGVAGVIAALLSALMVFNMPGRPAASRVLFLFAAILGGGALFVAATKGQRLRVAVREESKPVSSNGRGGIAELRALREAIAAGEDGIVAGSQAGARTSDLASDVGKLWRIQWAFRQGNLDKVTKGLAGFPLPSRVPLVELLRARVALVRNDHRTATTAYERVINLGPGRDALLLESVAALHAAGFDDQARHELSRVTKLGSREAWIYYAAAGLASERDAFDLLLRRAWTLQPIERADLVEQGLLWTQMRQRGPAMINLSEPREPAVTSSLVSTRPIVLPAAATASVSGELFHVAVGGAQLIVTNGACLAPAGVAAVDAGQWARLDEERALKDVPVLLSSASRINSLMQPALRDRISAAATTLGRKNRWQDVVSLTQAVDTKNDFVPPDLFFLRARALQHVGRDADAKALLLELAQSPVLARKRSATVYEGLGDMLASYDQYPLAITVFERAKAIEADGYSEVRLAQIAMDQKLATNYSMNRSNHFEVRYPPEISAATAAGILRVLEGEFTRLQKWIPASSFRPVIVNVVWWQDFKNIYTGSEDILGFYNGKITLPLAGIGSLDPQVVSLITHELTHAMLAQATRDQAPRWLQEGMAQRMEMVPYSANAFNMYDDDKLLAVSVLDAVLGTSRDGDMIGEAYIVSETFVRYLQESVGPAGMQALIASFAQGSTTEEAIAAVSHKPLAELDAAFRLWGKSEKRVFENPSPVRYDNVLEGTPEQPRLRGILGTGTLYPTKRGGTR